MRTNKIITTNFRKQLGHFCWGIIFPRKSVSGPCFLPSSFLVALLCVTDGLTSASKFLFLRGCYGMFTKCDLLLSSATFDTTRGGRPSLGLASASSFTAYRSTPSYQHRFFSSPHLGSFGNISHGLHFLMASSWACKGHYSMPSRCSQVLGNSL